MPASGITGGISTAKCSLCKCVGEILPEARFFNGDTAAHQLVDLDPQVKKELLAEFGAEVFSGKGDLNRKRLRTIIFQDGAKKSVLEKILHPRIRRQWSAEAERHRNSPDFFFADIPLLYETGGETLCDRVVVVACSPRIHLPSLLARSGMERGAAEEMIQSPISLEEKIKRADHVVWNNGDRVTLMEQAKELVALGQEQSWKKS